MMEYTVYIYIKWLKDYNSIITQQLIVIRLNKIIIELTLQIILV